MSQKSQSKLLLEGIPKDLKLTFKAACARAGKSMKSVIIKFMNDFAKSQRS